MVKEPRKYQSSIRCNFEIPSGIPEVQLNVEKDVTFMGIIVSTSNIVFLKAEGKYFLL